MPRLGASAPWWPEGTLARLPRAPPEAGLPPGPAGQVRRGEGAQDHRDWPPALVSGQTAPSKGPAERSLGTLGSADPRPPPLVGLRSQDVKTQAGSAEPRGHCLLPQITDGDTEALRGARHSVAAPPRGPALSKRRPRRQWTGRLGDLGLQSTVSSSQASRASLFILLVQRWGEILCGDWNRAGRDAPNLRLNYSRRSREK